MLGKNGKVDCAIILAGGKGERLRPLTNDRPKVMVEVAGKPILFWQIEWLKSHGVKKFVLAVSHKYEVDYSIESTPLGRGGGIKKAFGSKLLDGAEDVIVANGDIVTKLNMSKMVEFHKTQKALATLLLVPYLSRWGIVRLNEGENIVGFEEKPKLPYWINGGIYVFNKKIVRQLPDLGDHETLTFPKLCNGKLKGFKNDGFWRAVDVIKDRSEAEAFLEKGKESFS